MARMEKLFLILAAIPKTLYFNFRYFPLSKALRLPVIVSHRVVLKRMCGTVELSGKARFNMVRIGFHENPQFDQKRDRAVWNNRGKIIFSGTAYLGNGTKVNNVGTLTLGNNFTVSGNSTIFCRHSITFGEKCMVSWGCTFMDGDGHAIYSGEPRKVINPDKPIKIGDRVWFGMNCTVLKGVTVGNGCVVAANTCMTSSSAVENAVIGGSPLRVIRENISWES